MNVPFGEPTHTTSTPGTSHSLLARLGEGDQASWERFVRLYGPLVYSWCRRAGLRPEDARDVSQDVFAKVSAKLHQFQRERSGDSFRRWLKTVTNNQARDFHRQQRDKPCARGGTTAMLAMAAAPAAAADEQSPAVPESEDERVLELHHLLRQATELVRGEFEVATWQAFWQTAVRGRATADVAADLQLSANAVRVAKSRVRARLRKEMEGLLD